MGLDRRRDPDPRRQQQEGIANIEPMIASVGGGMGLNVDPQREPGRSADRRGLPRGGSLRPHPVTGGSAASDALIGASIISVMRIGMTFLGLRPADHVRDQADPGAGGDDRPQ